ncbi:MAG: glutathione S-transferase family protein [Hyphomicrobiaceae bacterium]
MITLYTFGPAFGLPDPSAFVTKAEVLLKMSGLAYRTDRTGFRKAPKGKLPYIDDAGTIVADSGFIRRHLEQRHGIDFDKGLTAEQRATGHAFDRMCGEHLYWAIAYERWMVKENFERGPKSFFDAAPAPIRPLVIMMIGRQLKRTLWGQGLGRHSRDEIIALGNQDVDAIAAVLGEKPWLLGDRPTGADAMVWSFVASVLCPHFATPIADHAARNANLVAYRDRGMARWFAEFTPSRL